MNGDLEPVEQRAALLPNARVIMNDEDTWLPHARV